MEKRGDLFIFIGTYRDRDAALADYEVVRELHRAGAVGTYDASLVTKDAEGRVHLVSVEMAARHAGWGGVVAGALVGLLFPPALVGTALVGGVVGMVAGHLWRGLSRADLQEIGEVIDAGEVALVVVGAHELEQTLDLRASTAERHVLKDVDVSRDDLDRVLREAADDVR
jgi:uncharacterized membrane protein